MNTDPFAEIEIDAPTIAKPQGQRIISIELDPVREKFYDMRGIAPNNPDEWTSAKLFYRQGKFMENFEDDYNKIVPLTMYSPSYQRMGYEQLRTYFTWRAKARSGEVLKTSLSYVFLYIYELLSGIGAKDPVDGLDKLMFIWREYRKYATALDDYLPPWLRDYHVYYPLPHSFAEFIDTHELHGYFSETTMFNAEAALANWLTVGNYDISKSKFYNDGNKELMEAAFRTAISALRQSFEAIGNDLVDLFYFRSSSTAWRPFSDALFHTPSTPQENKIVEISPYEIYICHNRKWTTRKLTPYKHKSDLAGWFVKTVEFSLRNALGFTGSFPISITKLAIVSDILHGMNMSFNGLSSVIDIAVRDVYLESTRVVVMVDGRNLERIREEAEATQEKLIVDDTETGLLQSSFTHASVSSKNLMQTQLPPTPTEPDFKSILTQIELFALKIILTSPETIKSFADENGIMLEILLDGINEKAMDTIGDNVLELCDNEIIIYDEYVSEIEAIC